MFLNIDCILKTELLQDQNWYLSMFTVEKKHLNYDLSKENKNIMNQQNSITKPSTNEQ